MTINGQYSLNWRFLYTSYKATFLRYVFLYTFISIFFFTVKAQANNGTNTTNNCTLTVNLGDSQSICKDKSVTIRPIITGQSEDNCPLTYLWSNGQATQNMETSLPGNYRLTIVDCNGCIAIDSIYISRAKLDPGTIAPSICKDGIITIDNTTAPTTTNGEIYEVFWIKSAGRFSACERVGELETAFVDIGAAYEDFLLRGGFTAGANPMIPNTTNWLFVTDDDENDLALTVESNSKACYIRYVRIASCGNQFLGKTNPIALEDCFTPCEIDMDGDNVCAPSDCDDNDPNIPAPPGTPCDDDNPNTFNDKYSMDGCTCQGEIMVPCINNGGDNDGDGVCDDVDCDDNDPTIGIKQPPGTACNDGDSNTIDDVIGADGCSCAGIIKPVCYDEGGDNDGDGVCDDSDCDDNNPNIPAPPGTPCDDGNPNTTNDIFLADGCTCRGVNISACINNELDNDGDGIAVTNDCDDNNPTIPTTPGTACNDGNPNTINDVIQADGCTCVGVSDCPTARCTTYNVSDVTQCQLGIRFSFAIFHRGLFGTTIEHQSIRNGVFEECSDGTATLTGFVPNYGDLNFIFFNKYKSDVGLQSCVNSSRQVTGLHAYDSFSGTVGSLSVSQKGPDFSIGQGGALHNSFDRLGASAWFNLSNGKTGDINIILNPIPVEPCCENPALIFLGNDRTITNTETATINASLGGGATRVAQWTTDGGDGIFADTSGITTNYRPGPNDLVQGQVTIRAITNDIAGCGSAEDILTLYLCKPDPCVVRGGDNDNDGICQAEDCDDNNPNIPAAAGVACDDGNPNTINDRYLADGCTCQGDNRILPKASINDITVHEEDGMATLNICLDVPASNTIDIECTVANGTAIMGMDYQMIGSIARIHEGENCTTLFFPILNDELEEPTKSFTVNIAAMANHATISDNQGTVTILDTDKPAPPIASISDITVHEEDGTAYLQVCLNEKAKASILIETTVNEGTATSRADFLMMSSGVRILPGQDCGTISFSIIDDELEEPTESFVVNMVAISNNVTIANPQGTVTILDTDEPILPKLSISDVTAHEEDASIGLEICLDQIASKITYVNYRTLDTSATSGTDYMGQSNYAFIREGKRCATVHFTLLDDDIAENTEHFKVVLSNAFNAQIDDRIGMVTIIDTDEAATNTMPTLSMDDITVSEEDGTAVLAVCLDQPATQFTYARYQTKNATALANRDYKAENNFIFIQKGELCSTINIALMDDDEEEKTENFIIQLTDIFNAQMDKEVAIVNIMDNDESGPEINNSDTSFVCPEILIEAEATNITIKGLNAPIEVVKIYNRNQQIVFQCINDCNAIEIIENLPKGKYDISINCYDDSWHFICEERKTVTITGVTQTDNNRPEVEQTGPSTASIFCGDVSIVYGDGQIQMSGIEGKNYFFKVNSIDQNWRVVHGCNLQCGHTQAAKDLIPGRYLITIYDADWTQHCSVEISLSNNLQRPTTSHKSRNATKQIATSKHLTKTTSIQVFPNPMIDKVHIDASSLVGQSGHLFLTNNTGQVVKEIKIAAYEAIPTQLALGTLPHGLYFLSVIADGQLVTTQKLVIQQR